jgi:hypothetical protein
MRRLALAGAAVLALGPLAAIGSASAAVTHPAAAVAHTAVTGPAAAPARPASPDAITPDSGTCPKTTGEVIFYGSDCSEEGQWACSDTGVINIGSIPLYASNGCEVRVWLYEGPGKDGYNLCLTGPTQTGRLSRTYENFWISTNYAAC